MLLGAPAAVAAAPVAVTALAAVTSQSPSAILADFGVKLSVKKLREEKYPLKSGICVPGNSTVRLALGASSLKHLSYNWLYCSQFKQTLAQCGSSSTYPKIQNPRRKLPV